MAAVTPKRRWCFYPRDAMLARVLAMALCLCPCLSVCVCLSQVGVETVLSKRLNESGWFSAWELSLTNLTLRFKEVQVTSKIRVLPSGNVAPDSGLEKFRHSISIVEACYRHSSERDKLDRRRSTELIISPSSDARPQ